MSSDAPVNTGHRLAMQAEHYEDREMWQDAIDTHRRAADQFQLALQDTQDDEARRSLDLLTRNHLRKANDLERKQRKAQVAAAAATTSTNTAPSQRLSIAGLVPGHGQRTTGVGGTHGPRHALSASSRVSEGRSQISESYAVLSNEDEDDDEDDIASDPFNKFFEVVETLVQKLSNPVAFASVPLNENDNPTTTAWKTEAEDPMQDMAESYFMVPDQAAIKRTLQNNDLGNDSSEPYSDTSGRSTQNLVSENERLKRQIELLTRRVKSLEKTAEESHMLKSSIIQFRNDVQKQAKRIMLSHDSSMRASSAAGMFASSSGLRPTATAEMVTRLRELEDENRQLRIRNQKQESIMLKYQERWEKLKESAKKRRAQPNAGDAQSQDYGGSSDNRM